MSLLLWHGRENIHPVKLTKTIHKTRTKACSKCNANNETKVSQLSHRMSFNRLLANRLRLPLVPLDPEASGLVFAGSCRRGRAVCRANKTFSDAVLLAFFWYLGVPTPPALPSREDVEPPKLGGMLGFKAGARVGIISLANSFTSTAPSSLLNLATIS